MSSVIRFNGISFKNKEFRITLGFPMYCDKYRDINLHNHHKEKISLFTSRTVYIIRLASPKSSRDVRTYQDILEIQTRIELSIENLFIHKNTFVTHTYAISRFRVYKILTWYPKILKQDTVLSIYYMKTRLKIILSLEN